MLEWAHSVTISPRWNTVSVHPARCARWAVIIEMLYALDKVAPGTVNDDTLLYGVEVKFYNMEVAVDEHLQTRYPGLYVIGDGSGITHSLSHASASGVAVARRIAE